jgi:hypothetical protein
LNENKFMAILINAATDLETATVARTIGPLLIPDSENSESTITLQGFPLTASQQRGRKRKRSESGIGDAEPKLVGADPKSWITVFLELLECVKELLVLSNQISRSDEGISFQLKLIFKEDPHAAAVVLGQLLQLSATAIYDLANCPILKAEQRLMSLLSACLEIWDVRSDRLDDSAGSSSNVSIYNRFSLFRNCSHTI